jgi:hypothetical protein
MGLYRQPQKDVETKFPQGSPHMSPICSRFWGKGTILDGEYLPEWGKGHKKALIKPEPQDFQSVNMFSQFYAHLNQK